MFPRNGRCWSCKGFSSDFTLDKILAELPIYSISCLRFELYKGKTLVYREAIV